MVKVYIASPYWDENYVTRYENVVRQMQAADALMSEGYMAFWPLHSHFVSQHFHRDESEWLEISLQWVLVCDVLLRLPGDSNGADTEVKLAEEKGIPVFHSLEELFTAPV